MEDGNVGGEDPKNAEMGIVDRVPEGIPEKAELPHGFKPQKFADDGMKVLVFFLKNSNHVIALPMLWENMRDFLNGSVIPYFGYYKGALRLYGTAVAVEGLPEKAPLAMIMMDEIAGWEIRDFPNPSENKEAKKALDLHEKGIKLMEKALRKEEDGDEWKLGRCASRDEGPCERSPETGKCLYCGSEKT